MREGDAIDWVIQLFTRLRQEEAIKAISESCSVAIRAPAF